MAEFNFKVGGEAGQGLNSIGVILLKAMARAGWHVFAHQDYESRIRGGHNFFQFRISDQPVKTWRTEVNLLVVLDDLTVPEHKSELAEDGIILFDPEQRDVDCGGFGCMQVPFEQLAQAEGGHKVMANAVAAGAIWALIAKDTEVLEKTLSIMFQEKGKEIVQGNCKAARAGFAKAREFLGDRSALPQPGSSEELRMVMKGNEALPLGALAGGLKFMAAYPMTPATGVTEYIAARATEASVVMEQTEDEIAAINMAIGAAYTGVRAMTATSGGGFSLMVEALGMAGSAEIPVVVINAMRPGPATGLPTRTEQADLLFTVHASHGEFARVVLTPGDPEEAFYLMPHAFNLAEKYQIPVIVLSDQHLADSYQTIPQLDPGKVKIERGKLIWEYPQESEYKRYALEDDGISPRLVPGVAPHVVCSVGDEHSEEGHMIEDARTRVAMMEKRMKRLVSLQDESLEPVVTGHPQGLALVGFGSSKGAIQEAVQILQAQGKKAFGIHLPQVYPLPHSHLGELVAQADEIVVVESSYTGQLAKLLQMEMGLEIDGQILRYDGRPLGPDYIVKFLEGGERHG